MDKIAKYSQTSNLRQIDQNSCLSKRGVKTYFLALGGGIGMEGRNFKNRSHKRPKNKPILKND